VFEHSRELRNDSFTRLNVLQQQGTSEEGSHFVDFILDFIRDAKRRFEILILFQPMGTRGEEYRDRSLNGVRVGAMSLIIESQNASISRTR